MPARGGLDLLDGLVYGFGGHGMLGITLGPGTSRALADDILGRGVPPRLLPFSPTRFARRVKPMPALTPSGAHA